MKHYQIEEFIGKPKLTTLAEEVEKKISLLYDFCILVKQKKKTYDARETALRKILLNCPSITVMSNIVHDLLVGKCSLNSLLRRHNYVYH